jgi:electron transport complex protein RnfC
MSHSNLLSNSSPKTFRFNGGLHLDDHKKESSCRAISQLPTPKKLVIPLHQHLGTPINPIVKLGDKVLKGQLLARSNSALSAAVHASSSGIITAITEHTIPHPSGLSGLCIEIETDGKETLTTLSPVGTNYKRYSPQELALKLAESGIVGMGGAAFPTSKKIQHGISTQIETLIINAAECEPWISCDQALMQERPKEIISAIELCLYLSGAKKCLLGIENNKQKSIQALQNALSNNPAPITIISIPTLYPSGGERQLIKVLSNKEVPAKGLPSDIGMLVLNVATAWAVQNYIFNAMPLISRIVTVTGDAIETPQNIEAPIGASISDLIAHAGGYKNNVKQLIMGGPMMGYALPHDAIPIVKASNCLLVQSIHSSLQKTSPQPCIRCSACAEVCPAELLPQQLYWYSQAKNLAMLEQFHLSSCIECGCCDHVCPSHIPLVHFFRYAKAEQRTSVKDLKKADLARTRFEARSLRLERLKTEKAEKLALKKAALAEKKNNKTPTDSKNDAIAAALQRSKERKAALKNTPAPTTQQPPKNED